MGGQLPGVKDFSSSFGVAPAFALRSTDPADGATDADPSLTVADLASVGVKRISIGGTGARSALNAFIAAAREMADGGRFTFIGELPPWREQLEAFAKGTPGS